MNIMAVCTILSIVFLGWKVLHFFFCSSVESVSDVFLNVIENYFALNTINVKKTHF